VTRELGMPGLPAFHVSLEESFVSRDDSRERASLRISFAATKTAGCLESKNLALVKPLLTPFLYSERTCHDDLLLAVAKWN